MAIGTSWNFRLVTYGLAFINCLSFRKDYMGFCKTIVYGIVDDIKNMGRSDCGSGVIQTGNCNKGLDVGVTVRPTKVFKVLILIHNVR